MIPMQSPQAQTLIDHNRKEWDRLLMLLQNMETNSLFWINCDRADIYGILRGALTEALPDYQTRDIYIDSTTPSLRDTIRSIDNIPATTIINVIGMDMAVSNTAFITDLNFHRDSLINNLPAPTIAWTSYATSALLSHTAYDFWSWVFYTFNFYTPPGMLTPRQQGFAGSILLADRELMMPAKDNGDRIRYLEQEWEELLKATDGHPNTKKQMGDVLTIGHALNDAYRADGRYRESINILEIILDFDKKLIPNLVNLNIRNDLAVSYHKSGQYYKAFEIGKEVVLEAAKSLSNEDVELGDFQVNLATFYAEMGELQQAKYLLELALTNYMKNYGNSHPKSTTTQSNLATVYLELGEWEQAKTLLQTALASDIENFGEEHPELAVKRVNLAMVYDHIGDFHMAQKLLKQALGTYIDNFGDQHPDIATIQSNLARVYLNQGHLQKTKQLFELALENHIKNVGDDHPDVAGLRSDLGIVYSNLGQFDRASSLFQLSLLSDLKNFGDNHLRVGLRYRSVAYSYLYLNERNQALEYMKLAYNIFIRLLGDQHPNTIASHKFLNRLERNEI